MAIIYSYPTITNLETTDLFIISRLPEDPEEISNYSVTLNSLSTYIIDGAFNGTDNYIPKFDGTASLVNSIIYQDDDGHVGIGVPGSTPNPVHKFEVYDDRSENISSDYTQVNSTVVGPPWTGGAGGVLSRLSTDGGSTFPYGISLIPGTTASDLAASGRLAFFSNSDLDTSAATGYSGQVTFDGVNPHWILGGNLTDTTTRTLHVKGDMLVDTDLEVDGGLDVAGTVRLGFTGNDPVILGDPNGKRTEWNNPGYFEMYAENPFSPGDFNETVDIDGEYYGGGFVGVYPANTENAHGVRMHVITDPSSASWGSGFTSYFHNFIDVAKANRPSSGANEQNIRISDVYSVRTTGEVEDYAGIKINHPTENRFRFNSEFNTEPTVPFLVNDDAKINGSLTMGTNSIFLGGTGAANEFDDYEEGTFNLSFMVGNFGMTTTYDITDFTNGTETSKYVKIGRLVHCYGEITWSATPSWGTNQIFFFSGFPFTPASDYQGNGSWNSFGVSTNLNSKNLFPYKYGSTTGIAAESTRNDQAGNFQPIYQSEFVVSAPATPRKFYYSFQYYTNN